jgi:hypothetical protein
MPSPTLPQQGGFGGAGVQFNHNHMMQQQMLMQQQQQAMMMQRNMGINGMNMGMPMNGMSMGMQNNAGMAFGMMNPFVNQHQTTNSGVVVSKKNNRNGSSDLMGSLDMNISSMNAWTTGSSK